MTVDHDVVVCDVGSVSSTSTTAADVHERVAELFRRPVVDDRVDARVEVRQTVPQHAHRLQYRPTSLRRNSDACKNTAARTVLDAQRPCPTHWFPVHSPITYKIVS